MVRPAQSLIELLIAVGAISAVLVAMASVSSRALSIQTSARTATQSTQLVEEQIERLRVYRDRSGYPALAALPARPCSVPAPATGCVATTCNINNAYSVTSGPVVTNGVSVCFGTSTTVACGGKIQVTAMAQWTDSKGTHRPTIKTCLSDWTR